MEFAVANDTRIGKKGRNYDATEKVSHTKPTARHDC